MTDETPGTPSISVIVPIRNEAAHIASTLQQLLDQDRSGIDVEILVADGRSTDETREIVAAMAEKHPEIRLFDNPVQLSSGARNVGIQNASGQYLLVVDGHCEIPTRSYFTDLVSAFQRTGADCLGRPQPLDVTDATPLQKAIAAARNSRFGHHPDSFIYSKQEIQVPAISVAVAYQRQVFDQIGLFDTRFDACEDCELNHRIDQAGLTCFLIPELAIRYQPRKSLAGLFKQLTRYGRGRIRLARKHREPPSLAALIPAFFLIGLIAGPILGYLFPVLGFCYLSVIGLYLALTAWFSLKAGWKNPDRRVIKILPCVFFTIHISSGWGVIREFLAPLAAQQAES
ncbi:MAG: glycosyltransferase family 2 protein [Mariniblastus sp.]|nr:glycosyltransferase family 2 protein [Mariniblastus sp.]